MKKSLLSKRNRFLFFLLMMISGSIFSQISLVNYPFTGNTLVGGRTFESTLQTQPPLINYFSGNNIVTPGFNNGRVQYNNIGDYLEITIDTRGFSNISLDFDAFYRYTALVGTGTWTVSYSTGGAYQTLSGITLADTNLFHPGEVSDHYSDTLPTAANNQQNLKIRITSSDFSILGTSYLYIDNINISAGNAVIAVYNQDNATIPHQSVASYSYDTDFGTVQTSLGSVQKSYVIRNTGSIALEISAIMVSGQNPADFQLSNIPTSVPPGSSRNFTVTFDPFDDGVRTADILIESNSSPNPYQFNVQGRGASCVLIPSAFRQNTFSTGTPSLATTGNYSPISGTSGNNYYPRNSNMYITNGIDTRSWIVNSTQQTLEFGPVNIANEKNVSISFYVAAATSGDSDNGVNGSSYVTLSVYNPSTSSWSDEMRLRGSDRNRTYYYYPYSTTTAGEFKHTFDGDNVVEQRTNGGSTGDLTGKISRFKLDIPETFGSELRFRINAYTSGSNRFWLIDEVAVNSENTVTKTFTAANVWVPSAPNADEKAIILGSYTVPAANLNVCECEVGEAGTVTIPNGRTLNVKGKITNHGNGNNFTVQTGGNLIQIEDGAVNTGSITAERLVSDINNISTHMDYLYWSAPVTGQNLQDFSPGTPANRIFQYNEPNDLFKAVPLATEPNFVPGKGYAFRAESGTGISNPYLKTYKFKGVPNNGLIEREVQRSPNTGAAADVVHGYNLIGNPYPSNMSFEQFYQLNSGVIHNTAWFWTNNFFTPNQQGSGYGQNNYAVWNGTGGVAATAPADSNPSNPTSNTTTPNGIVTVGQGFIVQVKNQGLGQKVQFRNRNGSTPLRVANAGTFFSRQNEEKDRFWLKLISADSIINSQLIGYIDGATNGYEQDYDAELMGMSSDVFYSLLEDRRLQIQGKAAFDPSDKVQLGANIFKNGTYTIAIENPQGIFNAGQKVYLKDNLLNRWVDLNAQSYTFEATKGITEGRFEIVYESPTVLATDAVTKDELMVYRDSGDFVVRAKSKKITMLEVYDASGRLVYTAKPNDTKVVISGDRLNSGVYILKISQDGVVTAKKILK